MPLLKVVDRDGREHDVPARSGQKLMETLRELDYGISAICGGMCSCATCHVYIDPAWVPRLASPKRGEVALLEGCRHYESATSRLGCQISLRAEDDGLALRLAPEE